MRKLHLAWLRLSWELQCLEQEQETLAGMTWNKLNSLHKAFVVRSQCLGRLGHLVQRQINGSQGVWHWRTLLCPRASSQLGAEQCLPASPDPGTRQTNSTLPQSQQTAECARMCRSHKFRYKAQTYNHKTSRFFFSPPPQKKDLLWGFLKK